jgi:hypothetical protein
MARDGAIISTWGNTTTGREAKSLEVFMEFLGFWGKRAAEGKCSEPKAFFNSDGSGGMSIVEGKTDALMEIWESDESERLIAKAQLIVQDLQSHIYWGGTDEEITKGTQVFVESATELGYM